MHESLSKSRQEVHTFSLGILEWVCARTRLPWQPHVPEETLGSEFHVRLFRFLPPYRKCHFLSLQLSE